MKRSTLSTLLLIAAICVMPVLAHAYSVITTPIQESVSILGTSGGGGSGSYASDMVYPTYQNTSGLDTDGWGWSGGAGAVQGGTSPNNGGLNAPASNEVFSFDLNNLTTPIATLNSTYGAGNWTIANPTLTFASSNAKQNNSRFGVGSGTYSIYWVADNNWSQAKGTQGGGYAPNPPYVSTAAALSAWSGGQADLGDETFSTAGYTGYITETINLSTADPNYAAFVSAITNPTLGGGTLYPPDTTYPDVSLYLMGTSSGLGMIIFTGGQSQALPALGFDVVANISVTPNPGAFPGTAISESTTQTFTIKNNGGIAWDLGTLSVSPNPSVFAIVPGTDTCSGQALAAGSICTVDVTFAPTSTGIASAALVVPVTGPFPTTSNLQVTLTGSGGNASVSFTPQSVNFGTILLPDDNEAGNVPAGCTDNLNGTVSCPVTLTNVSGVTLSNISLSTGNGPFFVSPSTIASLASNASAGVTVTYTATNGSVPRDTGTLTVYAGSYSASIPLAGVTDWRPAAPVNALPLNGTNVSLTPQLTASAFSSTSGATQASATWEISTNSQFTFSYGQSAGTSYFFYQVLSDPIDLTSFTVPDGVLQPGVTYYWSVGYTDNRGGISLPSAVTSFTTASVPMNAGGTSPLSMTVTDSSGNEVTNLSDLQAAISAGLASPRLTADLGNSAAINSGTNFNPAGQSPTIAIVRENGGASSSVLGIVTPPGVNIDAVTTMAADDPHFDSLPPTDFTYPAGAVSFQVTGVTGANNPVKITFYTPADLPANAVWMKYMPSYGWLQVNSTGTYDTTGSYLISSATTFTVVNGKGVLTVTDNDVVDLNSQIGVVLDPGAFAVPAPAAPSEPVPDPGPGSGGGCFIATAAFGSYLDPYVVILRKFRDAFLLTNSPGRSFVEWYYRVSPSIADKIRGSEGLKACVRASLMPVVGFSFLCLRAGLLPAVLLCALLLLMAAIPVAAGVRRLRYRETRDRRA